MEGILSSSKKVNSDGLYQTDRFQGLGGGDDCDSDRIRRGAREIL